MRFHIKERAWSSTGDFVVRDDAGNSVFEVRGKSLGFGDNMTLFDSASGQKLIHIKQRAFSLLPKYQLYDGNEVLQGTVSQRFLPPPFKVQGSDGTVFNVKGNVWAWNFSVSDANGQQVGQVSREFSLFRDSYAVDVAAGAYAPFIVALAVILERVKEKQRKQAET